VIRLVCLLLLLAAWPAWGRFVEAQGSATIRDGAVQLARQQAIQDALRQARLQTRAWVESRSSLSGQVLVVDSVRIAAQGPVEATQVLEEWREGDLYHVRIRAHLPETAERRPPPEARYRKRLAVVQFSLSDPRQAYDLPGIERAWPQALGRRLAQSGRYRVVDASEYGLPGQGLTPGATDAVAELARHLGVQFLITGILRDLGFNGGWWRRGRDLEVELLVFDGLSGALLARHRFSERVPTRSPLPGGTTPFSLPGFQTHPYGAALLRVLARQQELVDQDLAPLPFTARVVAVEGNAVTFDAGATAAVKPGDVLMTYRLDPQPLRGVDGRFLGYRETPVAGLTVRQVQPRFALGELEGSPAPLHPGDLIRFGWR